MNPDTNYYPNRVRISFSQASALEYNVLEFVELFYPQVLLSNLEYFVTDAQGIVLL